MTAALVESVYTDCRTPERDVSPFFLCVHTLKGFQSQLRISVRNLSQQGAHSHLTADLDMI